MNKFIFHTVFLLLILHPAKGQEFVERNFYIVDEERLMHLPYAQAISYTSCKVYRADSEGQFNINLEKNDSLVIVSMGYELKKIRVSDISENSIIFMKKHYITLQEVNINQNFEVNINLPEDIADNKTNEIPIGLRGDAFNSPPPVSQILINPLSYLHYMFSQKEISKRKVRKLIEEDKVLSQIYEIYSVEFLQEVTGLSGEKLDNFIAYCNINIDKNPTDNFFIAYEKVQLAYSDYIKSPLLIKVEQPSFKENRNKRKRGFNISVTFGDH